MSLRRIVLRDFVIVDHMELELATGFSVLTGETGAGKSILIDALQLVLGARADAGVVRQGAPRCDLAAEFEALPRLLPWLAAQGFLVPDGAQAEPDASLLLRRTIDAEGRSRAWVNGSPATLTQLKHLGAELVDIHGQHAWQSLTRGDAVRSLLDAYAGLDVRPVQRLHSAWRARVKALSSATEQQSQLQQESERLAWQVAELDKLAPQPGEWPELNQRHTRLAHAQSLLDAAQGALALLDEEEHSASQRLSRARSALQAQQHIEPRFGAALEALDSALALVQDTAHGLNQYVRHTELDPDALAALDQRLGLWMSLARRFRREPDAMAEWWLACRDDLARADGALDLQALQQAERQAWADFKAAADGLAQQRKKAAPRLGKAVSEVMQSLGMAGGRFEVQLERLPEPQADGWEQVVFLVAGHPGAEPRPVAKVASGGELSRIALAISVVTSRLGQAPTLVFDEVDSGIGGLVAHTVGRLLRQLGQDRQVLSVTHLAQVAACADQHLWVSKRQQAGQTLSQVDAIGSEQRVQELARMLGGGEGSSVSQAHAREMLTAQGAA